jgi:CubicO group peptidase (beta-lactamase class C family)
VRVTDVDAALDRLAAESGFSGAVRIDRDDETVFSRAWGSADRGHGVANTVDTQFAVASGTKGLTAVTVASLIAEGVVELATPVRSFLGGDLPLIAADVTVEHLLSHRSGIGDYVDEDTVTGVDEYVLPVPVHRLLDTEAYVPVLDGRPPKFAPGTGFSYCNSGYVVLALIAERAAGVPFHELVAERVLRRAGMADTAFLRSDELPGRAAIGYLTSDGALRTNVHHLPIRGNGDGGIYSTLADARAFWLALFEGRLVPRALVDDMLRDRSRRPAGSWRYGLGFWLHPTREVARLEGYDAGVSFRSWHDPATRSTCTVVSNTSEGAWPICRLLDEVI